MGYIDKIMAALEAGQLKPGEVTHVGIAHDEDCPKLRGDGPCICEPDIAYSQTFKK